MSLHLKHGHRKNAIFSCVTALILSLTILIASPVCAEEKEAKPLHGGKVLVGITQEPDFLDPQLAVAAGTKEILFNIFEGLTRLTPEGEWKDCLAESHEIEEDGKRYIFKLRDGVLFHNGKEMTEEDVIYSLRRAAGLDDSEPLLPQLQHLTDVRKGKEPMTVVVEQDTADADLLAYLNCAIIPADYDDQKDHPIGTGPYAFESYTPQVALKLKRFEDYRDPDGAYVDEVEFKIYGDMDAAMLELMSGQIDIFPYLSYEKADMLGDDYRVNAGGANMVQLLALNNRSEKLKDERVREAINLAVDRGQLVELTMGDYGTPLASAMTAEMGSYFNGEIEPPERDVEKARKLLKEAGYPDGLELSVTVPGNYLIHVDTAHVLASQLSEAGIKLHVESVEWGTWLEKVYAGRDYESTVIALTFEYTPSDVLNRYMSKADNNFINFSDKRFDTLAEKAISETDLEKRAALYQEMQGILAEKNASVFLQDPQNLTAVRKEVEGYVQYPAYVQDMSLVYYTDQAAIDESLMR